MAVCPAGDGAYLAYAERINLEAITPHDGLTSSGYCLANPGKDTSYICLLKRTGWNQHAFFVDLSNRSATFAGTSSELLRWILRLRREHSCLVDNPSNGERMKGKEIEGGGRIRLTAPFKGDAVLHLRRKSVESKLSND